MPSSYNTDIDHTRRNSDSFQEKELTKVRQIAQNPSCIFENTVLNLIEANPSCTVAEATSLANSYFFRTYGTPPR